MTLVDDEKQHHPTHLRWQGLFLFRFLFFLDGLGGSAWGRFGVIFFNQVKHVSSQNIGVLQSMRSIVGFFAKPLWGWVADRIQSRKIVFLGCKLGSTISLLTLAIPHESFPAVVASVAGMSFFPGTSVLDAHVLDFLGDDHREKYGSIRLWAAISWGLGSVIMGHLTDSFGFMWNFGVFGAMMLTSIFASAIFLPARSQSEQAIANTGGQLEWNSLFRELCQWQILVWLFEVTVMGAAMSLVDSFLFVLLQNDLQASTALCGYTVGVTVMLEIPLFQYSKSLLSSLGHDGLMFLAMLAYSVRVIGYTLLTPETVHWILLLEALHGITFACAWSSAVDFAAQVAPPEWTTLMQSTMNTFWGSIGGGVGPALGGIVYERYGPKTMFRNAGVIVIITMALHMTLWVVGCYGCDKFLQDRRSYKLLRETPDIELPGLSKSSQHLSEDVCEPLIEEATVHLN